MPSSLPILPDRALIISCGASIATLMIFTFFFLVWDTHAPNNKAAVLMQQMIELLNRIRVFNYNADQGNSCFHALLLIIFNMRLLYLFVFNENKAPTLIENLPLSRLLRSLTLLQFSIYVGMSNNHIRPCMRACRCACGYCTSLFTNKGCTSPEVHPKS